MTVLCTYGCAFSGGIERLLRDGLPVLARQPSVEVRFFDFYSRPELSSQLGASGVRICNPTGAGDRPPYVSTRRGLRRAVDLATESARHWRIASQLAARLSGSDVLYVHTYKELVIAALALAIAGEPDLPLVWHCHGLGDGAAPPALVRFAGHCTAILAISESARQKLVEVGAPAKKIRVIRNAVAFDQVRRAALQESAPRVESAPGEFVILVPCASLREDKGAHLALEALAQLPAGVHAWITGASEGGEAYARGLAEISNGPTLANRVRFLGFRNDIHALMRRASVVCVPSTCREGFGLVAAEAMALERPVVVSSRGGLPEVVNQGACGLIFDPSDRHGLAGSLKLLLARPDLAARLAKAGREFAESALAINRWAIEVADVLRPLGANRRTGRARSGVRLFGMAGASARRSAGSEVRHAR